VKVQQLNLYSAALASAAFLYFSAKFSRALWTSHKESGQIS